MTIVEAIKEILMKHPNGLTSIEVYNNIIEENLYQFNAISPQAIVNGTIRRHCYGLDFSTASPHKYFKIVGNQHGKIQYALYNENDKLEVNVKTASSLTKEKLPEEKMLDVYNEHISSIKSQLMNAILNASPKFFEELVLELLLKMNYGCNENSGIVTSISHDGGVDGIIKADELGLEQIYIQAKRFSSGNNVGKPALQQFAGTMAEKGIKKGVFFTTSKFVKSVRDDFSKPFDGKIISLIDGDDLMDLIIRYEIGVNSKQAYKVFTIDENYFFQ